MVDTVRIQRIQPYLWVLAPPDAPTSADPEPGLDTAVLEVAGGHLTWSLLSGQRVPAATLHDLDAAQEWLWALYGAEVALAAGEYTGPVELPARPEHLDLAVAVRRLGYARWAARWWPASIVDGIAALDPELLDSEIVELTEFCESVVDGADSPFEEAAGISADHPDADGGEAVREDELSAPAAQDYALAAGSRERRSTGLSLARGSAGWDWRLCPPGVVDASERAVSWELFRSDEGMTVRIDAVAAPATAGVPAYLRPHALVRTPAGLIDTALELSGDTWSAEVTGPADTLTGVELYVPGVGSAPPRPDLSPPDAVPAGEDCDITDSGSAGPKSFGPWGTADTADRRPDTETRQRARIRELVRTRLIFVSDPDAGAVLQSGAVTANTDGAVNHPLADIAPLQAETIAAEADPDF